MKPSILRCPVGTNGKHLYYAVYGPFRRIVTEEDVKVFAFFGSPATDVDLTFQKWVERNTTLVDNMAWAAFYAEATWNAVSGR